MIQAGARLGGVVLDSGDWWDLGTREQILAVHASLATQGAPWIAASAAVAPSVTLKGATAVGVGASIGAEAILEDCIVWAGAVISAGSHLRRCIVTQNALVSGQHTDADL